MSVEATTFDQRTHDLCENVSGETTVRNNCVLGEA